MNDEALFSLPKHFAPLPVGAPAYGNDPERRRAAVRIARSHAAHGMYRSGTFGEGEGLNFRGCDIACLMRRRLSDPGDPRDAYARDYGGPSELAWYYDAISEALPEVQQPSFSRARIEAVQAGADLSNVADGLRSWLLSDLLDWPGLPPEQLQVVGLMAELFGRRMSGQEPEDSEWQAATQACWKTLSPASDLSAWESQPVETAWLTSPLTPTRPSMDIRHAWRSWGHQTAEGSPQGADDWTQRARQALLDLLQRTAQGADPQTEDSEVLILKERA